MNKEPVSIQAFATLLKNKQFSLQKLNKRCTYICYFNYSYFQALKSKHPGSLYHLHSFLKNIFCIVGRKMYFLIFLNIKNTHTCTYQFLHASFKVAKYECRHRHLNKIAQVLVCSKSFFFFGKKLGFTDYFTYKWVYS